MQITGVNNHKPLLNYRAYEDEDEDVVRNQGNDGHASNLTEHNFQEHIDTIVVYVGQSRLFNITQDSPPSNEWITLDFVNGENDEFEADSTRERRFRDFDPDGNNIVITSIGAITPVKNNFGSGVSTAPVVTVESPASGNIRVTSSAGSGKWEGYVQYTANDGLTAHNVSGRVYIYVLNADPNRPMSLDEGGMLEVNEGGDKNMLVHHSETGMSVNNPNSLLYIVRRIVAYPNTAATAVRITQLPARGTLWVGGIEVVQSHISTRHLFTDATFKYVHDLHPQTSETGTGYSQTEQEGWFNDFFEFVPVLPDGTTEGYPTPVNIDIAPRNNQEPIVYDKTAPRSILERENWTGIRVINQDQGTGPGFDRDNDIETTLILSNAANSVRPLAWRRNGVERVFDIDSFIVSRNDDFTVNVQFLHEIQHNLLDTIVVEFDVIDPTDYCPEDHNETDLNGAPNEINMVTRTLRLGVQPQNNHAPHRKNNRLIDSVYVTFAGNLAPVPVNLPVIAGRMDDSDRLPPADLTNASLPVIRMGEWDDLDDDEVRVFTIDALRLYQGSNPAIDLITTPVNVGSPLSFAGFSAQIADNVSTAAGIRISVGSVDSFLAETETDELSKIVIGANEYMGYIFDLDYTVTDVEITSYANQSAGERTRTNNATIRIFVISQPAPSINDIIVGKTTGWTLNEGAFNDGGGHAEFIFGDRKISATDGVDGLAIDLTSGETLKSILQLLPNVDRLLLTALPQNGILRGVPTGETEYIDITSEHLWTFNFGQWGSSATSKTFDGRLQYRHHGTENFTDNFTFGVMLAHNFGGLQSEDVATIGITVTPRNNNAPQAQRFTMPALTQGVIGNFETVADDNLSRGDRDIQTFARIPDVTHVVGEDVIMILNSANVRVPVLADSIRIEASADGRSIEYEHLKPLFRQANVTTTFVIQLVDSTSNTPRVYSDVINEEDDFTLNGTGNRNTINVVWDTLVVRVNARNCGGAIVLIDANEGEYERRQNGGGCGYTDSAYLRVHVVEEGRSVDINVNLVLGANTPEDSTMYIVDVLVPVMDDDGNPKKDEEDNPVTINVKRVLDIDGDILHFSVSGHSRHNMATVTKRSGSEIGEFTYTHRGGTGIEEFTDTVHITIDDGRGHLTNVYIPLVIIPRKDEGAGFRATTVSVDEFASIRFGIRDSITTGDR
jgi:hypothetical protein